MQYLLIPRIEKKLPSVKTNNVVYNWARHNDEDLYLETMKWRHKTNQVAFKRMRHHEDLNLETTQSAKTNQVVYKRMRHNEDLYLETMQSDKTNQVA